MADLIEECEKVLLEIDPESNGISRRQIFEDISFMESSDGWEIELEKQRDGKRMYYRYSDLTFSINNMPLNEVEIGNLKNAVNILSQFRGMPQFEWINELLPKLRQGFNAADKSRVIMEFDNNQYLKGIEHLGELYNAIFYKKVLTVTYKPFEKESPYDVIFHPYYLKQYNNRWFIFGYNPLKDKFDWNIALDRIVRFREINEKYQQNTDIDWQEYFEDIIGVTKPDGAKTEKIVLRFDERSAKYIETKPLHGSQKPKWIDANTLVVSLQVIINYELERLILSYSDSVKVIQPLSLVNTIKERLVSAVGQY